MHKAGRALAKAQIWYECYERPRLKRRPPKVAKPHANVSPCKLLLSLSQPKRCNSSDKHRGNVGDFLIGDNVRNG